MPLRYRLFLFAAVAADVAAAMASVDAPVVGYVVADAAIVGSERALRGGEQAGREQAGPQNLPAVA